MREMILIIDLGSQYTQLIARRIREQEVYTAIVTNEITRDKILDLEPRGIILSGGPASAYDETAPRVDEAIFDLGIPILGICYGLQLAIEHFGGEVVASNTREYGRTRCTHKPHKLFEGLPEQSHVWMSHGDCVEDTNDAFDTLAHTKDTRHAAVAHKSKPIIGVQFHPEVTHTEYGTRVLRNFCRGICGCQDVWKMSSFIDTAVEKIRLQVKDGKVLCGLSGGIDSAVAALLIDRAIGDRLTCIFVDNGLLRAGEREEVESAFRPLFGDRLIVSEAREIFLHALKGTTDPELKRKRIGHTFIDAFKAEAEKLTGIKFLAQGTLYPDVIESVSPKGGPSVTIKSHHNVGGLPAELGFELVEPLRELFKDEVRLLGHELGLSKTIVQRQPFPGPGLAIRVLGEVTEERLSIVRAADKIVRDEFRKSGLLAKVWQSFAVLLPVSSVGVMGDKRTYENACVIRVVDSSDGMTADWVSLPRELLVTLSNRIINEISGINRVCLDISSKPPATIEWE
jgi:GMP synthase (glutamine-hydrolysing)